MPTVCKALCQSLGETQVNHMRSQKAGQAIVMGPIDTNTFSKMKHKIKGWFHSARRVGMITLLERVFWTVIVKDCFWRWRAI